MSKKGVMMKIIDMAGYGDVPELVYWAYEGNLSELARTIFENCYSANRPDLINIKDATGKTALHMASRWGKYKCAAFLLAHKADPNIPDDRGMLPIYEAAYGGHMQTVALLQKCGAVYDKDQLNQWIQNKHRARGCIKKVFLLAIVLVTFIMIILFR